MLKLAVLGLVIMVTAANTDSKWAVFRAKYEKNYRGDEHIYRRYIWQSNLKTNEDHNKLYAQGLKSYYLGENEYSDMTSDEFRRFMLGMNITASPGQFESGKYKAVLPTTVDWRQKGYVTDVKNQGLFCGSCYAFSATGSLEGQHFKKTGNLVSLSESNIVDCSSKFGNQGCRGGSIDNAFRYIISNKGVDTEQSYTYVNQSRVCRYNSSNVGATMTKFVDVTRGSEDALQKAVAEVGPVSVAVDATQRSWFQYRGGVYDEPKCSSTKLDHGVLVVGYGTYKGLDYWLVKNSFGQSFGINGYIMMSRNKNNQCGIATSASYPVV